RRQHDGDRDESPARSFELGSLQSRAAQRNPVAVGPVASASVGPRERVSTVTLALSPACDMRQASTNRPMPIPLFLPSIRGHYIRRCESSQLTSWTSPTEDKTPTSSHASASSRVAA